MNQIIGIAMLVILAIGIVSLMWHSDGIKETLATIGVTAVVAGWVLIALKLIFG